MNQNEFENYAIDVLVELAVDEGEMFYIIDHDDFKDYFDGNVEPEEFAEIVELIPNVDLDKFNERLVEEMEQGFINSAVCRAEYSL